MTFTGIQVTLGASLIFTVTGTASGGPGFQVFDANGAPAGSQFFSGAVSGQDFPMIVGVPANIYSLIGMIFNSTNQPVNADSQWLAAIRRTELANWCSSLMMRFTGPIGLQRTSITPVGSQ